MPLAAAVEEDGGDPVHVLAPGRGESVVLRAAHPQAELGELAARLAAQAHARELDGALEAGLGEHGLLAEFPGRLLVEIAHVLAQIVQESGPRFGPGLAHALEREQGVHRQRVLVDGARVAGAGSLAVALFLKDSRLPVKSAALGVPDVLARVAPQDLLEPGERLVVVAVAPASEGQPPQRFGRHVALGIEIGEVAEQFLGLRVLAGVGQDLGRTQAGVVGEAVGRKVLLDLRVEREGLVLVAGGGVRAPFLVERAHGEILVARRATVGHGGIEKRRRALALALLPHRLGQVKPQLAGGGLVETGQGQRGGEGRLGLRVLIAVEEDHAAGELLVEVAGDERARLLGGHGLGQGLKPLVGARRPGFGRRLGPHLAVGGGDLGDGPAGFLDRLGAQEHGFGLARPLGEAGEEGADLGFHLGPALVRDEGVDFHHHRVGLGHAARRDARQPGEGAIAVTVAQVAAGGMVGMVGREERVG